MYGLKSMVHVHLWESNLFLVKQCIILALSKVHIIVFRFF